MLRIATFGGVQPAALAELTRSAEWPARRSEPETQQNGRRKQTAAEIINPMKTQQEEARLPPCEFDGELAQKIIDEMFLFENLVDVDDRSIQRLLRSGFRIAADRPERRQPPLRARVPAQYKPSAPPIALRDDLYNRTRFVCLRWKTSRKRLLYCASPGGNRRNGDWQRRDTLCSRIAWQVWTPDDPAPPPERRLCRLRPIT